MSDNLIIEKKAYQFRRDNSFNDSDCIQIQNILYKLNVTTVFKPLRPGFSGMAIKITGEDEPQRFILVNSQHAVGKQHFTICHELYHLFIQENFSSIVCETGRFDNKSGEEYNADLFAAYLLLPENGIKALIPDIELSKNKITLKTILKIEQYFSCSRRALLHRLKQLNIIDSKVYSTFVQNITLGAWEHGYNVALYKPGNHDLVIGDYGTIAKELFDSEKISEAHYHSLLFDIGMDIDDIEEMANGEEF
jgi:Zn-dependent peptidase ImmA (M78 family)